MLLLPSETPVNLIEFLMLCISQTCLYILSSKIVLTFWNCEWLYLCELCCRISRLQFSAVSNSTSHHRSASSLGVSVWLCLTVENCSRQPLQLSVSCTIRIYSTRGLMTAHQLHLNVVPATKCPVMSTVTHPWLFQCSYSNTPSLPVHCQCAELPPRLMLWCVHEHISDLPALEHLKYDLFKIPFRSHTENMIDTLQSSVPHPRNQIEAVTLKIYIFECELIVHELISICLLIRILIWNHTLK